MIQKGQIWTIQTGLHTSGPGFSRSIDNPGDTGVDHGPKTHQTWLQGNDKHRTLQAIITCMQGSPAQGNNLGVRRGVMSLDRGIATSSDNYTPRRNYHRAYWTLTAAGSGAGLSQGFLH
jgi:hypothetical protein